MTATGHQTETHAAYWIWDKSSDIQLQARARSSMEPRLHFHPAGNVPTRGPRVDREDYLAFEITRLIVEDDPLIARQAAEIAGRLAGIIASEISVLNQSDQGTLPRIRDRLASIGKDCVANLVIDASADIGQTKRPVSPSAPRKPGEPSDWVADWAGAMAGPTDIERHFGIARSTLFRWQKRNEVISIRTGVKRFGFPLNQFVDGRPVRGIAEVLTAFADARGAWRWLQTPSGRFDDVAPLEVLKRGDVGAVVRAAVAADHIR